jgi:hypothetical protein
MLLAVAMVGEATINNVNIPKCYVKHIRDTMGIAGGRIKTIFAKDLEARRDAQFNRIFGLGARNCTLSAKGVSPGRLCPMRLGNKHCIFNML